MFLHRSRRPRCLCWQLCSQLLPWCDHSAPPPLASVWLSLSQREELRSRATMATRCVLHITLVYILVSSLVKSDATLRTCEPIRVELCRNLGYNHTGMPNLVGHEIQGDADFTLQTFSPLIQYGCSAQLHFFLCSVYVPMCTDKVALPIGPCRGLCESVRARCFPVLQGFGFPWPAALNCSKFPLENNHEHMCMEGPGEVRMAPDHSLSISRVSVSTTTPSVAPCSRYARANSYVFVNRSGRCAPMCDADILFGRSDKNLAEVWLSVWAGLCFVSTLLAVLTFLVDSGGGQARFRYPERPLAFLALCYNLASVGWGVRAAAGRMAVACTADPQNPARLLLSQDGLGNANCAVVFILLYYFGTAAAAVWWVVLTVSWFLSAALRWSHEQILQHSSLFHLAGWGLPAAQTIAILVLRDVDADELTGACFVGNQSTQSLLIFVLAPQFFYLVLGASLLVVGFYAVVRRRRLPPPPHVIRRDPKTDKGDAAVVRLGVFCVIYTVPAACVVASLFYEYWSRDDWLEAAVPSREPVMQPRPSLWVFLLRLFMSLVVGVTSAVWVWSSKSLRAWRLMFRRLGPYKQPPVKCHPIQYYPQPPHRHPHKHRKYRKHGSETTV